MRYKYSPSWLPIIIFDGFWLFLSFILKTIKLLNNDIIQVAIFILVITVCYSVYRCIQNNLDSTHKILFNLAKLPFWVLLSHALFLLSGTTFSQEGGWLLLYAIIILGVPLSALFFISGIFMLTKIKSKQT